MRMEVAVVCVSAAVGVRCFILAGLLALAACQTTDVGAVAGRAPDGAKPDAGKVERRVSQEFYTPFHDQGDHLKAFLRKGDLWGATRLTSEQPDYFARNRDKSRADLRVVADHLNAGKSPGLEAATAKVEAMTWPLPPDRWGEARAAAAGAESALGTYADHPLLDRSEFKSKEADALERSVKAFQERALAGAPAQYQAFDHFGERSFFEIYPISLDASSFTQANFGAIEGKLRSASADQLRRFAALYPKAVLGEQPWQAVGGLLVAASLKSADKTASPELKTVLEAFHAVKTAGFEVKEIPGLKIGFIEVTSRTLLKHRQIEFPAAIEVDLPVAVEKAEFDEALATPTAQAADYLIVFDVALAKASRRVSEARKTPSGILAGHRQDHNPEFDIVQAELNIAQNEVMASKMRNSRAAGPTNTGFGALTNLLAGIADIADSAAAKGKLDEAMAKLQKTPRIVNVPLYQDYSYDTAEVKATKTMTVHYHVIDKSRGTYFKSTFDVVERQGFEVLYNIQDKDPDRDTLKKQGVTEKDVAEWEEAPATVKLSRLVEHYLANAARAEKLPPLAKLREEMLADRNRALARHEAMRFDDRPLNDPRFDSVVAIYPSARRGIGSGFYVAPDVVLTNWHVVKEFQFVEMRMYDRQETFGKVIAKDARLDLALVRVQSRGRPVRFYTEKSLDLGATVEAIGHPKFLEFTVTRGVVSAIRRADWADGFKGNPVLHIQTDAAINPGNSGGPLFLGDRVVGVNVRSSDAQFAQSIGYAIHYAEVLAFLRDHLPEFAGWKGAGG